jgi:U3 small nucleolar RNA-associated protein 22
MKIEYEERPVHTSLIRALYFSNPAVGPTIRLALRWLYAHKFSSHIPIEAVEWLVAYVFASPRPYSAPSGHFAGFLRFLHLMATFNFEKDPIVVDLNNEFTADDYNAIQDKFNQTRKGKTCPLFIATPRDKDSILWTRTKPTRMVH